FGPERSRRAGGLQVLDVRAVVREEAPARLDAGAPVAVARPAAGADPVILAPGAEQVELAIRGVLEVQWPRDLEHARRRVAAAEREAHGQRGADEVAVNDVGPHAIDEAPQVAGHARKRPGARHR